MTPRFLNDEIKSAQDELTKTVKEIADTDSEDDSTHERSEEAWVGKRVRPSKMARRIGRWIQNQGKKDRQRRHESAKGKKVRLADEMRQMTEHVCCVGTSWAVRGRP